MWSSKLDEEISDGLSSELSATSGTKEKISLFSGSITKTNENVIPKKTITKHSKPYWSENLSILSKILQEKKKAV